MWIGELRLHEEAELVIVVNVLNTDLSKSLRKAWPSLSWHADGSTCGLCFHVAGVLVPKFQDFARATFDGVASLKLSFVNGMCTVDSLRISEILAITGWSTASMCSPMFSTSTCLRHVPAACPNQLSYKQDYRWLAQREELLGS